MRLAIFRLFLKPSTEPALSALPTATRKTISGGGNQQENENKLE
jgi:hypothetical protein